MLDLRPGAFGFPARGDFFFAVRTFWSNSDFGTASRRFMTVLKWSNPVRDSNCSAVKGGGYVSLVPVSSVRRSSATSVTRFYLSDELLVSNSATDNLFHNHCEPLSISDLSVVIAKCLLIQIAKQVERLNTDVCTVQAALQEGPKVLHCVGMDVLVRIFDGMIDNGVLVVVLQTFLRLQLITEDSGARFDILTNLFLKFVLAAIRDVRHNHVATTLHHPHDDLFVLAASAVTFCARFAACMLRALPPMKVSSTSTSPPSLLKVLLCMASRIR
jgi:hypothetical protein